MPYHREKHNAWWATWCIFPWPSHRETLNAYSKNDEPHGAFGAAFPPRNTQCLQPAWNSTMWKHGYFCRQIIRTNVSFKIYCLFYQTVAHFKLLLILYMPGQWGMYVYITRYPEERGYPVYLSVELVEPTRDNDRRKWGTKNVAEVTPNSTLSTRDGGSITICGVQKCVIES